MELVAEGLLIWLLSFFEEGKKLRWYLLFRVGEREGSRRWMDLFFRGHVKMGNVVSEGVGS